ncbi:MAG: substrate-binding domain-containing protein, partial [Eubacterium sp.]|nr:substrate-binding domain-containing protein [Eubacterium sp.]
NTCIVQYPDAATADAQITVIQNLISQQVDAIMVAGNDTNALQSVLQEAMNAGIKVGSFDSSVNAASRQVFVNQAGNQEIGTTLMEAVYDLTGGEGQWAILSATSQATNQNAWIEAMKGVMEGDDKYSKLELVEVAYGDDEAQKSTDQTQALLSKYPDLKLIVAPTTVGIMAAAKVLQDEGSSVKLTGLGLPSEMAAYIGDDDAHSCPYMYLWNPIDLGKLAGHVAIALCDGTITGAAGDKFTAGDMGDYEVVEAADGGTEIILGAPFKFDPSNIAEWKDIY